MYRCWEVSEFGPLESSISVSITWNRIKIKFDLLELQLALKPNPVLESKPAEPRHGSRIGTKNVGKWYFFGKSGLGLGVHRQFTVGSKPSYPELGLIPRIGIETRLTSKIC